MIVTLHQWDTILAAYAESNHISDLRYLPPHRVVGGVDVACDVLRVHFPMIIHIKRYAISWKKDRLTICSVWPDGRYRMSFKIQRWNPLTYIIPIVHLAYRKLFPKTYLKKYPDKRWYVCFICDREIGVDTIAGLHVCARCKDKYD